MTRVVGTAMASAAATAPSRLDRGLRGLGDPSTFSVRRFGMVYVSPVRAASLGVDEIAAGPALTTSR